MLAAGENVAEHILRKAGGLTEGALAGEVVANEPEEVVAVLFQAFQPGSDADPAAQVLSNLEYGTLG